jgi:hypothetical protein
MEPFNWKCPHCEHDVTIGEDRLSSESHILYIKNVTGQHAFVTQFIVCPNSACKKYTLSATLYETVVISQASGHRKASTPIKGWRLVPWGKSRTFPDYVPQAIRDDYVEACSIVDLSPKAAATLARRAVQGIVRDYWKIVKNTLNLELQELEGRVGNDITRETWDSIDAVRSIGNIGAHMEKDINVIIDVDPGEAQLLIELVEVLIADTYIARHEREEHRAKLLATKARKQAERGGPAAPKQPE